jgi:hypothetical protein
VASISQNVLEMHSKYRIESGSNYQTALSPASQGARWGRAVSECVDEVNAVLKATNNLNNILDAVESDGSIVKVLRFFLGPPQSQDQFQLVCPEWKKSSELGTRSVPRAQAEAVSRCFDLWQDNARTKPIRGGGSSGSMNTAVMSTAIMMAINDFRTEVRNEASVLQERAVGCALESIGYVLVRYKDIDRPDLMAAYQYAVKTNFATSDGSKHEVDVAVGLGGGRILALECKVSNDSTNSIKRVNDILKKASSWKGTFGTFVVTGAMLQGVYGEREPRKLLEANVELFWSHRLDILVDWIKSNIR